MNTEFVYKRRAHFIPLFCRQIMWAIIEEARAYFAQHMSPDDFVGVHPDNIRYPRSSLILIDPCIRNQMPIVRLLFPPLWIPGSVPCMQNTTGSSGVLLPTITTPTAGTVVSGITNNTGTQPGQQTNPVKIRQTNIHPQLKAAMEQYIQKFKGVQLTALLSQAQLTLDDLPKLPADVAGTNGVCYNYVLGRCTIADCRQRDGHVQAQDITDDFVTDLLEKLRPSINEFMAIGIPRNLRRRPQKRHQAMTQD